MYVFKKIIQCAICGMRFELNKPVLGHKPEDVTTTASIKCPKCQDVEHDIKTGRVY